MKEFIEKIPSELLTRSGKVFYSGRNAFQSQSDLYVLGLNPGGSPTQNDSETISSHTNEVLNYYPADWSAYRDELWEGRAPGTHGMAPRVLYLFAKLGLNPGSVPCSNLIFVRSRRESHLNNEMTKLIDMCWPFHASVLEALQPKVVLCFGKTAGNHVRHKLGAYNLMDEFIENNRRRWRSQTYINPNGIAIVVATHPSIVKWNHPSTDPTHLVIQALK